MSGSAKVCVKILVSPAQCIHELVQRYLRFFYSEYSEKKLLYFVSLVILVSSVAQWDFAQILLFVELWEKK